MDKLIVILGPTSSGKSSLGIKLAKRFNGEIISADSRQVYKGLDIGTGKVTRLERKVVPHHLLDVASPKKQFTVAEYKRLAQAAVKQIHKKGKVPILVGGTAFYIYALIDDLDLPEVKPNKKLRQLLAEKSPAQLFYILKRLDPVRAQSIDANNPARLIRAIEIVKVSGQPVPQLNKQSAYNTLILGITHNREELFRLIDKRLGDRIKQGLLQEVRRLLNQGLTHKRLQELGLEYKFVSLFLQKKISRTAMVKALRKSNHDLAKRQLTWFRRDKRIKWVKNTTEASKLVKKFLTK